VDTTQQPQLIYPHPETQGILGGIGRTTLYKLIDEGHLTQINIGRRSFITAESIQRYVANLTAAAETVTQ
jgi:excisionase family DNA binding protein